MAMSAEPKTIKEAIAKRDAAIIAAYAALDAARDALWTTLATAYDTCADDVARIAREADQ